MGEIERLLKEVVEVVGETEGEELGVLTAANRDHFTKVSRTALRFACLSGY